MKVIDPNNGFDMEAAHKILALVERRQGWTPEANARHIVNEHGEVVRSKGKTRPKPRPWISGHWRWSGSLLKASLDLPSHGARAAGA